MNKINRLTGYFLTMFMALASPVHAADLPGSSDPAGIKRYEGSEIIRSEKIAFDTYQLPLGKMVKFDFGTKEAQFEQAENLEGSITRVTYRLPDPQRSSLEVFRNYETELLTSGWEILWKASGKAQFGNSFTHIFQSLKDNDQLLCYNDAGGHVLSARKAADGLYAMLFVTKYDLGLRRKVTVEKGDPLIQLDVITTKKMEQKMVFVAASEMAKSIQDTGRVALYGINFDFNSSEIKADSEPTVAEIGKLLTAQPTLKVIVAGHTDNVGGFEFNRDLSERRASSVIASLEQKHGIKKDRLRAFGVSSAAPLATNDTEEGRAKNRRVEIVAGG